MSKYIYLENKNQSIWRDGSISGNEWYATDIFIYIFVAEDALENKILINTQFDT